MDTAAVPLEERYGTLLMKDLEEAIAGVFNSLVESKEYFLKRWKEGVQSENVLLRYKTQQ